MFEPINTMQNMTTDSSLQKVSTYAKNNGVSTMAVYKWISAGKIKCQVIDGVKFVVVEAEKVSA